MSIEFMNNIIDSAGLKEGCDVELAEPFISRSGRLIDIGAGTGRTIKTLRRLDFSNEIYALERSAAFIEELQKIKDQRLHISYGDMFEGDLPSGIATALWLFSGITDFSPSEQQQMIAKIWQCLSPGGYLVIDSVQIEAENNGVAIDKQVHEIRTDFALWRGFVPSDGEIRQWAINAGFREFRTLPYRSSTLRKRNLFLLRK